MRPRRHHLVAAALILAPFALTGCQKPPPGVTVWSGTNSEHVGAACWQPARDQVLGSDQCAQDVLAAAGAGVGVPHIEVAPGATVGISVDPAVADGGWTVQVAGQPLAQGLRDTYYRFTFPEQVRAAGGSYSLEVIASATPTGTRGLWFFQLTPR